MEVRVQQSDDLQSPTIETRNQVRNALPFNTDIGRKNIITNGERCGNNQETRGMQ